jgi:hypothetical protein
VAFQPKEIFWEKIREKLKQLKINNSINQVREKKVYIFSMLGSKTVHLKE